METLDFEHGRVYFKQFGAERVKALVNKDCQHEDTEDSDESVHTLDLLTVKYSQTQNTILNLRVHIT